MKKYLKTRDIDSVVYVTIITGDVAEVVREEDGVTFIFKRTLENLNAYRHYFAEMQKNEESNLASPNEYLRKKWWKYYKTEVYNLTKV